MPSPCLIIDDNSFLLRVKVIPNAKCETIAGIIGNRLKIKVNSPPESGKANTAVCKLIANVIGIKPSNISIVSGMTKSEKSIKIYGVELEIIEKTLGLS